MSRFSLPAVATVAALATALPVSVSAQIFPNAPRDDDGWNLQLDFGLMACIQATDFLYGF